MAKPAKKQKIYCPVCKTEQILVKSILDRSILTFGKRRQKCKKCTAVFEIKNKTKLTYDSSLVIPKRKYKPVPSSECYIDNIPDLSKLAGNIVGFKGCLINEPKFVCK
jgi:hypothetical protein